MIWYLAVCQDCEPAMPQPFLDPRERAQWVTTHREATDHTIRLTEDRWAAPMPE